MFKCFLETETELTSYGIIFFVDSELKPELEWSEDFDSRFVHNWVKLEGLFTFYIKCNK